ncbi:MAG: hypothetical protein AAB561_00210 [Patescibacteria group bacterium]
MIINELKDVLILILGWLLGLLGPVIVDAIKDKREAKAMKAALFSELHELQYRLMLSAYQIESRYGELNHEFFLWAQGILVGYKGVNSSESLLKIIGPLLKLTDEQMKTYAQQTKQQNQPISGLSLKKYSLSLLESYLSSLAKFDSKLRGHLLELKVHIAFINEVVDDARYYFRLSFQNNISPTNYDIANNNMIDSYKAYKSQARVAVEIIGKILSKK